jgi:hypothetical protein
LDSIDDALDVIKQILNTVSAVPTDFKSIKDSLFPTFPPKIKPEGPFIEIGTDLMLTLTEPILQALSNVPIPWQVVLLGCSFTPARIVFTKLHPYYAIEKLPTWEKLSLDNLPFVIWLDQLVATAQRQGGFGSDYVLPYWLPDA